MLKIIFIIIEKIDKITQVPSSGLKKANPQDVHELQGGPRSVLPPPADQLLPGDGPLPVQQPQLSRLQPRLCA